MKIAYTMTEGKGDLDQVLFRFAKAEMARGQNVVGVVQVNTDREDCPKCDMDVEVLPDGPTIRISQDLGPNSQGCRLDPEALEQAVAEVSNRLGTNAALLVINKFGKHEASGRGFRDTIGQAIALGVPVLCGVNGLNKDAFEEFTDGHATFVEPDPDSIADWFSAPAA
ncbi:DUF2478 domain-containing protein [Cognatishimia activa]|uniref:ABC-type molybdate transport system, ATPase component n=1 Tax=Cognatishimia activa TaxID=1715691 RepID=A0A0P1ILE3_9RHOB|nr:DUF2478 domain-containing protein [Cognatishimia activa]CUI58266.1 ABC-type molybdate transport system, ATPase component [Cognatishimia activa]CUK24449.1 ABC-type molybdate transport system, ATPase component [Cognatishimia activa]